MIKKLKSSYFVRAVLFCLVYIMLFNVLGDVLHEKMLVRDGRLAPRSLTTGDFTLIGMDARGDSFICTDSDPQLLLTVDGDFYGLKFYMTSSMPTGEIPVYYTLGREDSFSERRHTWATPVEGEEGRYIIRLDLQRVHTLRIDPTNIAGNMLTFGDFTLNPEKAFSDYFPINHRTVPLFLAISALLWAFATFISEIFTFFRKKTVKSS